MPKDLSAQQVGTQRRNTANDPKTRVLTGMTKFPMSYQMPNTARYGHITPFYYQHSRGDDTIPLFSEHELRTYTLKSPMMSDLNMNKSYFMVDMQAIYPRNWHLMFVNPSKGDDVPEDARAVVRNLLSVSSKLLSNFKSIASFDGLNSFYVLTSYIRYILFMESIYSAGSLFSEFDIHLQNWFKGYYPIDGDLTYVSFDTWFDTKFAPNLLGLTFSCNNISYCIVNTDSFYIDPNEDGGIVYINIRRALEIMRDNEFVVTSLADISFENLYRSVDTLVFYHYSARGVDISDAADDYPINLEVIIGYQLGCAQFFTDSHIDYVYNADLFRKAFESYDERLYHEGDYIYASFPYNGSRLIYDAFSGNNITSLLNYLSFFSPSFMVADDSTTDEIFYVFQDGFNRFAMLFNHRNSLRYGDYFVTGRPNPLGIGDVSVDTSQASVSVVDITRNIQMQRFLNAVNLAKQNVGDYARSVLGLDNAHDISYDIPAFLGHKTLSIRGMEIENTGSEQRDANSVTTILRSANNIHAFELRTKRPCLVYGVYTFDVPRIYTKTFDRMHMHEDRFDDFIPQLQYVGDQPIYKRELDSQNSIDTNFAYAVRYMEYKIRHHYAAGGAIESLPSWFFITDGSSADPAENGSISPDFIRSKPYEFDRFYSSLTGYSLGTYFHFIVKTTNHQTLTRKMDYAPEPLK